MQGIRTDNMEYKLLGQYGMQYCDKASYNVILRFIWGVGVVVIRIKELNNSKRNICVRCASYYVLEGCDLAQTEVIDDEIVDP